jgi:hypothetical protein
VHRNNTFQRVHKKCALCTETEHFPDGTSEMCTVHRNTTLSRRYIRNVYFAQKYNTLYWVHQKCVLCTESTLSGRYIRNVYSAQNTFQTVHQKCVLSRETTLSGRYIRNVYCAQKQNTFHTAHTKQYLREYKTTFKNLTPAQYWVRSTDHSAPRYAAFSIPLSNLTALRK